ncbi:hypothetical protein IV203_003104 [Nitzschia inconspicua]|uniref:Uncharacterized protein n=1 Tax=Nitzschia inconspicua TaxID=303405 RepID=A0A9K3L1A2_9STRA|nr:hypothetical protein IV203_003104 [Nitzschia inconspicua]
MVDAKYKAIPDAEQPEDIELPPSDVLIARAQERYPEAGTKVKAEFLGRLDDAIDNCQPRIEIPRISPDQLQPSTEIEDQNALLKALKLPTTALVAMIAAALLLMITDSPLAKAIYPYVACITTFLSSVPDIRKRFLNAAVPVFDKLDTLKGTIERRVEGVSATGMKYLDVTEKAMNQAIAPIKDNLAFATKMETALRQIDPKIDIPDTSDIEEKFNDFERQLKTGFEGMQHAVDISRDLPAPLQSIQKFQLYIMGPFLAVMLALQLWGIYTATQKIQDGAIGAMDDERMLVETGNNVTVVASMAPTLAPTSSDHDMEAQLAAIWLAFQSYVSTVVQIIVAFLLTKARAMAAIINSQIAILEKRVNEELRKAVGDVFENIFQKGFGAVKVQFLKLVKKIDKIQGPINQLKAKIPGGDINIPTNVMDKIPKAGGSFLGKFGKK